MSNATLHALGTEAGIAAEHLAIGATALGQANYAQRAYYGQAFFALSVGIERSSKLAIVTEYALRNDGRFPSASVLRSFKHNLERLLSEVTAIAERRQLDQHRVPRSPIHEAIIEILTSFANNVTRYYSFEVIGDGSERTRPDRRLGGARHAANRGDSPR